MLRRLAARFRIMGRPQPRHADQLNLERLMGFPQLPIVHAIDAFPKPGAATALRPVGSEVPVVDLAHLGRKPSGHMNTISNMADRHILFGVAREEWRPHGARHLAMK